MSDTKQPVIIYGAEWCPPCHVTKDYLTKHGIEYDYRNIEENEQYMQEAAEKSGANAIPVIDINGTIIVGFDRPKIDAALGL